MYSYITTSNVYWNSFRLDNLSEMPFSKQQLEKCTVEKGDLLVLEGGAYYGRAAIWPYEWETRIQNHIHRLRSYGSLNHTYIDQNQITGPERLADGMVFQISDVEFQFVVEMK